MPEQQQRKIIHAGDFNGQIEMLNTARMNGCDAEKLSLPKPTVNVKFY